MRLQGVSPGCYREVIQSAHTGDRMDFDPEILVRLHWAGLRVIQVRTPVTYPLTAFRIFAPFGIMS